MGIRRSVGRERGPVVADTSRVIFPLVSCVALVILHFHGTRLGLWVWFLLLCACLVWRGRRLFTAIFAALTLYAVAPFLRSFTEVYPPFPSRILIEEVTNRDLQAVAIAFAVSAALAGPRAVGVAVGNASTQLRLRVASPMTFGTRVAALLLLIVAVADWLAILRIGLGAIAAGNRRAYASDLWLTQNHIVQVLAITASLILVGEVANRRNSFAYTLVMVSAWTPYILVGSRKELIIVLIVGGITLGPTMGRVGRASVGLSFGALLAAPALRDRDPVSSFHEFILPQYMQFSLDMNLLRDDFGGSFISRAQFLLPGFLRLSQPRDLGATFEQLKLTPVGVGVSPFAEMQTAFGAEWVSLGIAAVMTCGFAIVRLCASRFPAVALLATAQLFIAGRSDVWISIFFVSYAGMLLNYATSQYRISDAVSFDDKHAWSARRARSSSGQRQEAIALG